jgi:hypothetical protein
MLLVKAKYSPETPLLLSLALLLLLYLTRDLALDGVSEGVILWPLSIGLRIPCV